VTNGAEERLARVTYLPGVTPPAASASFGNSSQHGSSLPNESDPNGSVPDESEATKHVPLETIPGLVKASELSSKPVDLPGKRFAGHTGEIERIEPNGSSRAHNVSLSALARRGVSSEEMANLLARRELDAPAIEAEIERLERVGLLDDSELARTLVRTLRERKGLGRSAITAELRRRRIDPAVIADALEEADEADDGDELTRARELAARRAPQLRSLDPETARRRLGAFLMRKGYSGSIVASAVASALAPNHPALRRTDGTGPRFH
jgi:regulatory protein